MSEEEDLSCPCCESLSPGKPTCKELLLRKQTEGVKDDN